MLEHPMPLGTDVAMLIQSLLASLMQQLVLYKIELSSVQNHYDIPLYW